MNFSTNASQIPRWLMDQPHIEDGGLSFTQNLVDEFVRNGLELWRLNFTLNTMHPEVLWRTLQWQSGVGIRFVDRPHSQLNSEIYQRSPIPHLRDGGAPIYVPFDNETLPYPICEDLRKEGATAYFAIGTPYSFGEYGYISFATKNKGGFSEDTRNALIDLTPYLARRIELESSCHMTNSLLQVYLGTSAADRVIKGNFKRGRGEIIQAAIWFCDLRGFTELSSRTEPLALVELLDTYFEIVTNNIIQCGGDVLKFIGDAVLAVFPVKNEAKSACESALKAAEVSLLEMSSHANLSIGISLHLGNVLYGNIGGRTRLDFTVISSAVNEASRLEGLCKLLNTNLILSKQFVEAGTFTDVIDLGVHNVKGVNEPLKVFTRKRNVL